MVKSKELKFYTPDRILATGAHWCFIFGERSNGKSYAILNYLLKDYCENGNEFVYIRRYERDLKNAGMSTIFADLERDGKIIEYTDGNFDRVVYYAGRFYLAHISEDGKIVKSEKPIGYTIPLTAWEHSKSTQYPFVNNILFEEALTRSYYLPDEFIILSNVCSTVIRHRNTVKIFMIGNAVSKYCPYVAEMGLKNFKNMQPGDLDVYTYGDSGLKVAVEFADSPSKNGKPSDVYFAFDNPKLNMITGKNGVWEVANYPHLPYNYLPKEIIFEYFIKWEDEIMHCEIIQHDNDSFTYVHRKTTELKEAPYDIIFSADYNPSPTRRRRINRPTDNIGRTIWSYYPAEKVYYQDNELGELMRNYLQFCESEVD